MQAAGIKRQKRRGHRSIYGGKRFQERSEIIEGADFETPVQLYNTLPMYDDIDLEHIKEITKQRQRALNIIDCKFLGKSQIFIFQRFTPTRKIKKQLKQSSNKNLNLRRTEDYLELIQQCQLKRSVKTMRFLTGC
jgi:hypothetical protein